MMPGRRFINEGRLTKISAGNVQERYENDFLLWMYVYARTYFSFEFVCVCGCECIYVFVCMHLCGVVGICDRYVSLLHPTPFRQFWLFTDMLLYAKPTITKNRYEFRNFIPLAVFHYKDMDDTDGTCKRPFH